MPKIINHMIVLTTILKQEVGGVWTAECQELGTATFGDTFEEAKDNLEDAIAAHLNTLEDVGECERFFKESGIEVHKRVPNPEPTNVPYDPNIFVNRNVQKISTRLAY